MKIRKATLKDLDELTGLYVMYNIELDNIVPTRFQFFKKKKKSYDLEIKKDVSKLLKNKKIIILVAEDIDKSIIGMMSGRTMEFKNSLHKNKEIFGYPEYIFVLPSHRSKGIASSLKNELFKWFRKKKVDFVRLEVSSANSALKKYQKWGFEIDSIKMIKRLK